MRIYPYAPDREDAQEHCLVARLFARSGANVPEILFCDNSKKIRIKYSFDALVEEYIEAQSLSEELMSIQPMIRQRLAQTLASLHQMTNHLSGKIWQPVNERRQPLKYFAERINLYFTRLSTYHHQLTPSLVKHFTDKMHAVCKPLSTISSYNLIHGDLQPENLLLNQNGGIIFLDYERSCFGYLEEDLVCVLNSYFRGLRDNFQLFLNDYCQAGGG
ncbi:MAG: aminoglycoside phosphotransferase family protein [Candidatus Sumerlaeia bacterium]|nr:aminoglycoside phosphotransferase family protein [Candidatus Sumerlaeia bacterium]